MKLKRENIQQWFSLEEAVKFIFEDDDASVKNLIEFIENNQLSVYLKKYTHTQHSVDTKKDLIRYLILSLDSLISYSNSKIKMVNSSTKCNAVKKTCRRNKPMPFTRSVV